MGTPSTITIVSSEETHRLYSHWDGYPTGVGVDVAKFLASENFEVATVREKVNQITFVRERDTPTREQWNFCVTWGYADPSVSTGTDWYAALRNIQGDLGAILESGFFPEYSHGPEPYDYRINLDEETLTVSLDGEEHTFPISIFKGRTSEELQDWAEWLEDEEDEDWLDEEEED